MMNVYSLADDGGRTIFELKSNMAFKDSAILAKSISYGE
jgi:hypothetical protein